MLDLDMSPYGPFVWGAYGVSALVLIGLSLRGVMRAMHSARRLADLETQT